MFGLNELIEREARIDARGNCLGVDFIAVREDDSLGFAIFDDDFCDGCLRANFDAGFTGRVANSI